MTHRVNTDCFSITQDEAVEAVAHHLRLAAMFFEATSEDNAANREEILRLVSFDDRDAAIEAAKTWLDSVIKFYEKDPLDA